MYKIFYTILCLVTIQTGIFAQTTITIDPACQSCPLSATLNSSAGTPVPTPLPSCGTVAGAYKIGTALTAANTITLSLNVVTVGGYTISTTANGMTFTGTGTFAGTGAQSVVLTGSGTPLKAETTGVMIQYGGSTCSAAVTVTSNAPTAAAPPIGAVNSGSLGGKTCFDVAISNDDINGCAPLTTRIPQKADFTLATTNTQIYTFTPRGTVSNVRFSYVNTNGNVITALVGGNAGNTITTAVTATATFNTGLNAPATGLTNSNPLTADIYCVYNDGATNNGVDRQVKITPYVKDCACCGAWSYVSATQKVWLEFMCHNVGADESLDPFVHHTGLVGDYYQWGRNTDGHEKLGAIFAMTATNVVATSSTITPNTPYLYSSASGFQDWSTDMTSLRWSPIAPSPSAPQLISSDYPKGPNDPCPAGWKVPSWRQWGSLIVGVYDASTNYVYNANGTVNTMYMENAGLGIGKLLFLPMTGGRTTQNADCKMKGLGDYGLYWSSSARLDASGTLGALTLQFSRISSGFGKRLSGPAFTTEDSSNIRCVIDK